MIATSIVASECERRGWWHEFECLRLVNFEIGEESSEIGIDENRVLIVPKFPADLFHGNYTRLSLTQDQPMNIAMAIHGKWLHECEIVRRCYLRC